MNSAEVNHIASALGVDPEVVRQMEGRLASQDESFQAPVDDEEQIVSPEQYLVSEGQDPAAIVELASSQQFDHGRLMKLFKTLDERAQRIIQQRWLQEKKSTLHELADQLGISAERVRQLEQNALKKLRLGFSVS